MKNRVCVLLTVVAFSTVAYAGETSWIGSPNVADIIGGVDALSSKFVRVLQKDFQKEPKLLHTKYPVHLITATLDGDVTADYDVDSQTLTIHDQTMTKVIKFGDGTWDFSTSRGERDHRTGKFTLAAQ